MPERKVSWWYCWKVYWKLNFERGLWNGIWYHSYWIRTPLFSVGHELNSRHQSTIMLVTGWTILWLPTRWNLRLKNGGFLYRHDYKRTVFHLPNTQALSRLF